MAASVFNKSRVDRASRSSRVTISTSPGPSVSITRRSCARPVLAPLGDAQADTTTSHGRLMLTVLVF